ncbi:hypothetical protein M501DRAFT_1004730 [Patellaria atrata CBS 101060]|uniref:Family c-likeg-protein-coupled receptor protein n=1 Tax=Patellaria atrata CBS 101060 TaxID=1346257 RepID=A0A9P4SA45_9PEZI|nr:hypothetical protein M501DRAFT_1004730 [Patellaria atrata CBS 101060]
MSTPRQAPYVPTTWALGGRPKTGVDVPVTAVFLALFIIGAVVHMTIFQKNNRQGHKFIFSVLLFGFCMARITTTTLRIASTCLPHNIRLAIAAQILVAAGILLIFIINLIFTQRIIRSQHPQIGWHRALTAFFLALYVLIGINLAIIITVTVQSFYTLDRNIRRIDRDLQLYVSTFFTLASFLPLPLLLISHLLPRRSPIDSFGHGTHGAKTLILLAGTLLACLGAAYRCGTAYLDPVPMSRPLPDYFHKACFYVFNFGLEVLIVFLYAFTRIDRRFWIPNGAKGPGSYSSTQVPATKRTVGQEKADSMYDGDGLRGEGDEVSRPAMPDVEQAKEKQMDLGRDSGVGSGRRTWEAEAEERERETVRLPGVGQAK